MQDLRFAIRSFRRQPIFTLVALLTLGIGIGGNTAIFSLFYQVLLRPLPYPDTDRLVFIWNTYPRMGLPQAAVSIPDYLDRLTQAPSIEDATLVTMRSLNLASEGRPEQLRALAVTPSFFTTFHREPERGRAFGEADAQPDADKFAILTASLWRSRFGADPAVIGREIRLSGEPYQVVGILPADFELPARDIALLVPYSFTPVQRSDAMRGNESSQMIARLNRTRRSREFRPRWRPSSPAISNAFPNGGPFPRPLASVAMPCRFASSSSATSRSPSICCKPACCWCS